MTVRLYSHPISPCCQKVKFLLLEKNIKFEEVFIDLGAKQNLSNTYLKINPSGTVPTLQDNKKYIFESKRSMGEHVRGMLKLKDKGSIVFDYGNNIRSQALEAGVSNAFDFP